MVDFTTALVGPWGDWLVVEVEGHTEFFSLSSFDHVSRHSDYGFEVFILFGKN